MKINIIKPPIPIIFIDTFFYIDLVSDRTGNKKSSYHQERVELMEIIETLTQQKKLLCPKGNQEEEYRLGLSNIEEIQEVQERLSMGISTNHYFGVEKYQVSQAISAYVKKGKTIEFDYRSLFLRDPLKELGETLNQRWLVSVHTKTPESILNEERILKKELAAEFENLRLEKKNAGLNYETLLKRELLAELDLITHTLQTIIPKLITKQPLDQKENTGLTILSEYLALLSRYSKKEVGIAEVVAFIKSDYYSLIPFKSIKSQLYSSLLSQTYPVNETDNFDFEQSSQWLPFSNYFLTDRSLRHRLTSKQLQLDKVYNVKIYSMREIRSLISELKSHFDI